MSRYLINNIRIITLGSFLTIMLSGCIVYHTQTTDIPLINHKNDLRIDAGASIVPSVHATISYGLTDKVAIQGFGTIGTDDRYYFQAATGLYKNNTNSRVLELYGGFGYGYGNAYRDANPGNLLGDYQLYFVQLNYGKIANELSNFEIGFGIKAGYLHSNLTDRNYYKWISETGPYITYHDESLLIEPVGFIRTGGKKLKFSVKLGGTLIQKFTNSDKSIPYDFINLGLGINFRL
ncbi:MAG: hypothetical protein RBS55_03675 [Bacteroidales bacterium]|jgi:hypothetical protein|nr:hypothetical protein [Bacteroidales bacterium]